MNLTEFWNIIAESRMGFDNRDYEASRDKQEARLRQLLSALPIEDVVSFDTLFGERMQEAYGRPEEGLWAVAFDIGGGCSDDCFLDFRSWLISMGREVFEAAIQNPETVHEVASNGGLGDDVFWLSAILADCRGQAFTF